MFADPTALLLGATVTPSGGTSTNFARIRTDGYASEYRTADGAYDFAIKHSMGNRNRSEARLTKNSTYTDPSTGLVVPINASVYFVVNRPSAGFTNADIKAILNGLNALLSVSAVQDKILGFES